jgi:hypothetical protein
VIEIACDESGSEGESLIGATTDVFAHAGVRLDTAAAAACVRGMRERGPTPALEYKANHVLRERNRPALVWLLGPAGPLHGNAHVYLVDKAFFVVGKVVDLLVAGVTHTPDMGLYPDERVRDMAATLHGEGPAVFGAELWAAFLVSANNLMRPRNRRGVRTSVDSFFRTVDEMGRDSEILGLLAAGRTRAEAFRARLRDEPAMIPALDPLNPALIRAVARWGPGPVAIVHDETVSLSDERIRRLFPTGRPALTFADSRTDPRVQVADVLAGAARAIASDEINGRSDAELVALLRPFVDPSSVVPPVRRR